MMNKYKNIALFCFFIYFQSFGKCFVITPRMVPDNMDPFLTNHDVKQRNDSDMINNHKPWLAYIKSSLNKSLLDCFANVLKNVHFKEIMECTLHFQPSSKAIKQKMKNVCPVHHQINNNESPILLIIDVLTMLKQVANMRPNKLIMGRITISTEVCAIFKTCSLH